MLGIIIGIASIITIVSTIKGTNEQIKESLVGAGNNAVVVQLYQDNYPYEVQYNGVPAGVYPITEETRQELCKIDHVKGVSLFAAAITPTAYTMAITAFPAISTVSTSTISM